MALKIPIWFCHFLGSPHFSDLISLPPSPFAGCIPTTLASSAPQKFLPLCLWMCSSLFESYLPHTCVAQSLTAFKISAQMLPIRDDFSEHSVWNSFHSLCSLFPFSNFLLCTYHHLTFAAAAAFINSSSLTTKLEALWEQGVFHCLSLRAWNGS